MNNFTFFLLIALLITPLYGQKTTLKHTPPSVFFKQVTDILDKEIPILQKEQNVQIVGIGLIENGKLKLAKVYGEHQNGSKATNNTIFNVASITKSVVAVTILKLVSQGKFDLDEPLYKYWIDPDVKDNPLHKKLTARHCLSHTTGFKNWRRMTPTKKLEFDFEPGTKFQYSGEGMEYLRRALENKLKKGLDEVVKTLIFEPLMMNDSSLKWLEKTDENRFAKWFDAKGKLYEEDFKTTDVSAADDLLTTVGDLAKFGVRVMNPNFLGVANFKEMVKPQSKIHNNANQGLGWTIIEDLPQNNYAINHDGGDTGVATTVILLPNQKSGIIVFTNGDNGRIVCNQVVKKSITFGSEIIKKLYWGGKIPQIITIEDRFLTKFAGTYRTNQGTMISFSKIRNALKISGEGIPGVEIYPLSDNEFFPTDFEVFFKFYETEKGEKFELLNQGKIILEGIKVK